MKASYGRRASANSQRSVPRLLPPPRRSANSRSPAANKYGGKFGAGGPPPGPSERELKIACAPPTARGRYSDEARRNLLSRLRMTPRHFPVGI